MSKRLGTIATEVAHRWMTAQERRFQRGKAPVETNFENLRDFADGVNDELDCLQLDIVADQAVQKIANFLKLQPAAKTQGDA
jgi:hypothetical protein